ncbi:MAG TPA: hypothetical protein DCS66_15360 [Flavobacteriaceae bacterium]|nr:hypothetical protein [Flavobacteriaceae bacterium]|tara:strand:+ start:604 stop:840 length:237 start_codon:yes stop_codon:yes gene_type:complete
MKISAKTITSLVESMRDLAEFQQKIVEQIHAQKEVNGFLSKRIKDLETKVLIMQSQQHVIDIVSNISRQKPMKEVFDE